MNENEQPDHDLLEEAIHAFQQMSVPEQPAGAETLALFQPSPRKFRMYAIISSAATATSAAVLALVAVPLVVWNVWAPPPKPEPEPVPVAVTKAPGQAERSSLADVPRLEKQVPQEDHSSLPVPRLEDNVKQSPVVVVATAESFSPAPPSTIPGDTPEVLIQFKVQRVLKGKYAAKTLTTRMSNEKIAGRDHVSQIVGKDWVACLSPNYLAGKSQSAPLTSAEFEARFKDIIAKEKK